MSDSAFKEHLCSLLLALCRVGRANRLTVAICKGGHSPEIRSFQREPADQHSGDKLAFQLSNEDNKCYPIASLTKPIFAMACALAEAYAGIAEHQTDPLYSRIGRHLSVGNLSDVYNHFKTEGLALDPWPGGPACSQLLVHKHGMPTWNHHLLGPCNEPLQTQEDLVKDLNALIKSSTDLESELVRYSNCNYAAVGLVVKAVTGVSLAVFLDKTLFRPLEMRDTCIGFGPQVGTDRYAGRFLIRDDGAIMSADCNEFEADAPEAAAVGIYSTPGDLTKFMDCLVQGLRGGPAWRKLPLIDEEYVAGLLPEQGQHTTTVDFRRIGMFAPLASTTIGILSNNRLQHPHEPFTEYETAGLSGDEGEAYYMAGSAVGCSHAYAFLPNLGPGYGVIVMTNTSGPVDIADHALRLVLRWLAYNTPGAQESLRRAEAGAESCKNAAKTLRREPLSTIIEACKENWDRSCAAWRRREEEFGKLSTECLNDQLLPGRYENEDYAQWLEITEGGTAIRFGGSKGASALYALRWEDKYTIRIYIPTYKGIDHHGEGDWADGRFTIEADEHVVRLRRNWNDRPECFTKQRSAPS